MGDVLFSSGSRFRFRQAGLLLLLLAADASLGASPALGQVQRTFGIHLGQVRSKQLWSGPVSTETANGLSLGLNVDVPTPLPFLTIRAELGYVRRGSVFWDQENDPERLATARVGSHYLSIPIQGKVFIRLGPASAYVFAGPTLDQLLETQCTQSFCGVLSEENPSVFSVSVGSGVSFDVKDQFRGELEVRLTEGLTEAYRSGFSEVHYRSLEILVRACLPF